MATSIFQEARVQCKSFEVIIWGVYGEPKDIDLASMEELGVAFEVIPQLFFVKRTGHGCDDLGQVEAAFSTRSRLRDQYPEVDVLAYDPGFTELDRHVARI